MRSTAVAAAGQGQWRTMLQRKEVLILAHSVVGPLGSTTSYVYDQNQTVFCNVASRHSCMHCHAYAKRFRSLPHDITMRGVRYGATSSAC
mmetsp:Transcript_178/g.316  ORF Transcript_178/g.316 Transcript_178/m.316 type:complete len:90 (+) Transcript_178:776-1045(+)